jgi:hypothetical protein
MPQDKQARAAALRRQKDRLAAILQRCDGLDRRFTLARLISFLGGAAGLLVVFIGQIPWWALGIPAVFFAAFGAVVFLHRRLDRGRLRFRLASSMVATQQARMDLDWEGIPAAAPIQVDPSHPFAADLNIVGSRSLHQLIDTAASRGGSERLAGWLLQPLPDPDAIQQRHAILNELIPLNGFRSRLALVGMLIRDEARGPWDGERLMKALEVQAPARSLLPTLGILFALAAINIALFILNLSGVIPPYWIIGLGVYGFIYMGKFNEYRTLFEDTYWLGKALNQLASILSFLEKASYAKTSQLARLCKPFIEPGNRPSRYLRKLVWITTAAGLGNNPVLAFALNVIVPWNLFFATILNGYKRDLREPLLRWLDTWYEIEALCSLANFAWLNPGYAFPHILTGEPADSQEIFRARRLGHPLIPEDRRVCNDFSIQKFGVVGIITGSNMSGKSTFLRTVGINLCLANAGGPAAAAEMSTRLFRLFTCIQVSDSLADGISYFYAEVRRLKQLLLELEKASPYPLFYLIDEIYRGTNNRERRVGSQAYIHTLSHSQGVGLVSTHDLDLVHISNQESSVLNYHFREAIQDGRMVYDYSLRPGPSPTTNALKIMELEGLPVEQPG